MFKSAFLPISIEPNVFFNPRLSAGIIVDFFTASIAFVDSILFVDNL